MYRLPSIFLLNIRSSISFVLQYCNYIMVLIIPVFFGVRWRWHSWYLRSCLLLLRHICCVFVLTFCVILLWYAVFVLECGAYPKPLRVWQATHRNTPVESSVRYEHSNYKHLLAFGYLPSTSQAIKRTLLVCNTARHSALHTLAVRADNCLIFVRSNGCRMLCPDWSFSTNPSVASQVQYEGNDKGNAFCVTKCSCQ
jgi:hypothetical protein